MRLFNNWAFIWNPACTVKLYQLKESEKAHNVFIIDDLFADFAGVRGQFEDYPICRTGLAKNREKCEGLFDGRKNFTPSIEGTDLPYLKDVCKLASEGYSWPIEKVSVLQGVSVNVFSKGSEFPEDCYYSVHRDPSNGQVFRRLGLVLFGNTQYEQGEGLNFYQWKNEQCADAIANSGYRFTKKSDVELLHTVQAKPNRGVLFDGHLVHGQHTPTDQFVTEYRETFVNFLTLNI